MVWKEVSLSWREKCVSVELRRIHKNFVTRAYVDTGNCNMIGDKYIMFILWWHIIYIHSITYIYMHIYIEQTCACIYIYVYIYLYIYICTHMIYLYSVHHRHAWFRREHVPTSIRPSSSIIATMQEGHGFPMQGVHCVQLTTSDSSDLVRWLMEPGQ